MTINDSKFLIGIQVGITSGCAVYKAGWIIGRVSGRAEFGAGALGNRSIIVDPGDFETINKINKKIKRRDFWMPFTPSIIEENADEYLENKKGLHYPFMSVACETKESAKQNLKAALHPSDQTARPQIVEKRINPEYYEIISEFKKLTGVGGLLNKSLNLHGLPIVQNVSNAVHVLENSKIDAMIINKKILIRENQ